MSVVKRAFSALGKLGIIIAIAIAFFIGLLSTVYLSLRSPEVKVPDVVGKDVMEGEAALDKDGLNMRRRASRFSPDAKPNTILDQSPHAGEVIKVGQTVAVVISRSTAKEGESPVSAPSTAEENFGAENKNTSDNTSASKNDNENVNKEKANRNTRNKNTNNSNNSNNGNANNSNANRNTNNRNANNRNANERNTNDRNANDRNVNNRNANANRATNANGRNTNSNRNTGNANSNRRAPVLTTPPFNPNPRTP